MNRSWVGRRENQLGVICIKMGEREEMRVLRGVVYMMKNRGPRTEPWEHHRRRYIRTKKCYYI